MVIVLHQEPLHRDKFYGYAVLDLSECHSHETPELMLSIEYADEMKKRFAKQGRDSRLVVRLMGTILSQEDLASTLGPTAMRSAHGEWRNVYVPLDRGLYCGVKYSQRSVGFSICMCKRESNMHVDIGYAGDDLEEPPIVTRRFFEVRMHVCMRTCMTTLF